MYGIAILALPLIAFGTFSLWRGMEGRSWPIVQATIANGKPEISSAGRQFVHYTVRISYHYNINGKQYQSNDTTGQEYNSKDEALEALSKMKDTKISIHYKPASPDQTSLSPEGQTGSGIGFLLLGGIMTVAAAITWFQSKTGERRPSSS